VIDPRPVLAEAVETARPLIEERRHRLSVEVGPDSLRVDADPSRLEQVAVNLLTNAAKYTPAGGRIWLSVARDGPEVVIAVRDDGMGIPPEQLPAMFELFTQGERSLARSEGGLGIGLTLVKTLVELHGGSVEARSEGPGTGCVFEVRLPAAGGEAEARGASSPDSGPGRGDPAPGRRVLIIDDNVDTARTTARLLQADGHEVRVVHNGPNAIAEALRAPPDVILLDIGLPGMDGYEVASRLRSEGLSETLIVAVSGYGDERARRRSLDVGIDRYLVKPVDLDDLIREIERPGRPG
jgi:CheY-like chemotaxis protein/anti-sigma regulatory factor (Ser/Thr protein kinase)